MIHVHSARKPAHERKTIFQRLFEKRSFVLTKLYVRAREEMRHAIQARSFDTDNSQSSVAKKSKYQLAVLRPPAKSTSSVHPLLRWSLMSMFPLIDSVRYSSSSLCHSVSHLLLL